MKDDEKSNYGNFKEWWETEKHKYRFGFTENESKNLEKVTHDIAYNAWLAGMRNKNVSTCHRCHRNSDMCICEFPLRQEKLNINDDYVKWGVKFFEIGYSCAMKYTIKSLRQMAKITSTSKVKAVEKYIESILNAKI
jgi:hypothetical protein